MRKKAAAEASAEPSSESEDSASAAASRCSQSWAMLIKRVYEVNPLCCVRVRRPDDGGVVHRTSPGGRDRRDPHRAPSRSRPKLRLCARRRVVAGAHPREGHQKWIKWIIWSSSSRASYMDSSIDSQDQAELSGADLHRHRPVPGELLIIPTRIGTGTMRTSCGVEAYSTSIHVHVALRQASIWLPASRNGRRCVC